MMKLLLAFVALCTLYVRAQNQAQNGEPDEAARCQRYPDISEQYETCKRDRIKGLRPNYSADMLYTNAKLLCKNRVEILECTGMAFENCSNALRLYTIMNDGFDFCALLEVDPVMATFFENNAGRTVRRPCYRTVLDEVRVKYGRPRFDMDDDVSRMNGPPSLETMISYRKRFFTWYISKFMLADLDETLKVCDGMTRRTVFGIMIASINVESYFGLHLYQEFTNMVQGDVGMFNLPA